MFSIEKSRSGKKTIIYPKYRLVIPFYLYQVYLCDIIRMKALDLHQKGKVSFLVLTKGDHLSIVARIKKTI